MRLHKLCWYMCTLTPLPYPYPTPILTSLDLRGFSQLHTPLNQERSLPNICSAALARLQQAGMGEAGGAAWSVVQAPQQGATRLKPSTPISSQDPLRDSLK